MKLLPPIFFIKIAALVLGGMSAVFASGGGAVRLDHAPIDYRDNASLQRGAQLFVNYCLNCHSAQYMRYNRLRDIGLTENQIKEHLILNGAKVGETMTVPLGKMDAKRWLGVAPPDLSVTARSRGADWLYTYLRAFYRDDTKSSGWNNLVFPSVGMPHVLWELSGQNELKINTFKKHEEASAALLQTRSVAGVVEEALGSVGAQGEKTHVLKKIVVSQPGKLTPAQYDQAVADLVNYLVFMGEPARNQRVQLGIMVLLFLTAFFFVAYALKKEYWRDIH